MEDGGDKVESLRSDGNEADERKESIGDGVDETMIRGFVSIGGETLRVITSGAPKCDNPISIRHPNKQKNK